MRKKNEKEERMTKVNEYIGDRAEYLVCEIDRDERLVLDDVVVREPLRDDWREQVDGWIHQLEESKRMNEIADQEMEDARERRALEVE